MYDNKNIILKKAQEKHKDDGKIFKSRIIVGMGCLVGVLLCLISFLIRFIVTKQFITDTLIVLFGMYSLIFFALYFYNEKKKSDLIFGLLSAAIFAFSLTIYVIQIF